MLDVNDKENVMKLVKLMLIIFVLTSCGSTENTRTNTQSSNTLENKLFGGDLRVDKEWYVFDTCGRPRAFDNGSVRIDGDKIFIDFTFHRNSVAFEGTYDNYTGFVNVAGTDRFSNGRIGKEPRAGVFLPESNTLLLSKKKFNRFSPCELILSLDDDDIDDLEHGNESLKRSLVHNYTVKHNDLWLTRVKERLQSQNQTNPKQKLEHLNASIRVSKVFIKYSDIVLDQFNEIASIKRDEYANLVINDFLNDYQEANQLSLTDLDNLAKLPENESELFGYLFSESIEPINTRISNIINPHATKEFSSHLSLLQSSNKIESLVNIEDNYRDLFSYLQSSIKQHLLSMRSDYVYELIRNILSNILNSDITLNDVIKLAHYHTDNAKQWRTLTPSYQSNLNGIRASIISDHALPLLEKSLQKAKVEKIYDFQEFYYSKGKAILSFMTPEDQNVIDSTFHAKLNTHCSFDMALTLSTLLETSDMLKDEIVLQDTMSQMNMSNNYQAFCYARLLDNYETTFQDKYKFVNEARNRFDKSRKHCSVIPATEISFLKEVEYELPFYERSKFRLKKKGNVGRQAIKKAAYAHNINFSNAECKERYPKLPFKN